MRSSPPMRRASRWRASRSSRRGPQSPRSSSTIAQPTRRELATSEHATTTPPTFRTMKLGLGLDVWSGAGLQMPTEQVRTAERLGFDSVWTAEAYRADAITPLAFLAAQNERIW